MGYSPQKIGLGSGVYTYADAARLLGVSTQQVRRWCEGYVYRLNGEEIRRDGVLEREQTREGLLTFHDLIELVFVREFASAGVRLQRIVDTARLLREKWHTAYPFAYKRLQTDGSQILLDEGGHYANVAMHQQVFRFAEQFFKNIDFDGSLASLWWPMGHAKLVVLDPQRSFGAPIDARRGIRTQLLHRAYIAEERDVQAVADWYDVEPECVETAVEFEEQWLKRAA